MWLVAEEAAKTATKFDVFDLFIIALTILIAIGVFRTITNPVKNFFAIGFGVVSLIVFLIMDAIMVKGWLGL